MGVVNGKSKTSVSNAATFVVETNDMFKLMED